MIKRLARSIDASYVELGCMLLYLVSTVLLVYGGVVDLPWIVYPASVVFFYTCWRLLPWINRHHP